MFLPRIEALAVSSLAFIGMAKNAGKTTALNAALQELETAGREVGLLSVGVDGEHADAFSGAVKPSIVAPAGSLVATAELGLRRGTAAWEIVESLGIRTPMGELFLARVRRRGTVLLAGTRHRADVAEALSRMRRLGVQVALVDGAFDRTAAADPRVTDAVVVATGAVCGETVAAIARRTREFVARLDPPRAEEGDALAGAALRGEVAVRGPRGLQRGEGTSALADPAALLRLVDEETTGISLPGVVTDRVVDHLLRLAPPALDVVLPDATHLLASEPVLRRAARRGRRFLVARPIRVLAVTVNPHAPGGTPVDPVRLLDAVALAIPGVPVADARSGRVRGTGA